MVVKNNKQYIEWDKGPNCSLNCLFQSVLDVIFFLITSFGTSLNNENICIFRYIFERL